VAVSKQQIFYCARGNICGFPFPKNVSVDVGFLVCFGVSEYVSLWQEFSLFTLKSATCFLYEFPEFQMVIEEFVIIISSASSLEAYEWYIKKGKTSTSYTIYLPV
jgi:hypothetical protein